MITGAIGGPLMNIRGVFLAGAALLACVLVTGRAQAQQIYLEIPGVEGEVVTPAAFANQIEILSMSWGGSRPCGSGSSLSLSSMNVMKKTDKATVNFAIAIRDRVVYPTATFRFTRSDGQVYQTYQLSNVVVESLQTSGSAGGDPRTTESVSFAFASMAVTYTWIDGGGKAQSMTFTAGTCP
jgi:type VI secretion system secreted protein Hcp